MAADKPWVLDLFCCAGGASKGYQLAGYKVLGVDMEPRPNYCGDEFVQAEAHEFVKSMSDSLLSSLAFIHWSPPCQASATLTVGTNASLGVGTHHVDLIPSMRPLIEATGLPHVLEQPAGRAPMRKDLMLCMDMFPVDPPRVFRHRWFELNDLKVDQPEHFKHKGRVKGWNHGKLYEGDYVAAYGTWKDKATVPEMQHAMGIDWTSVRKELTEAIPPAYTKYIGTQIRQNS